jgi:DNA-directed RNA polymerase specialized sigma24 family protein
MSFTVPPSRHQDELDTHLCTLIATARCHPCGSIQRQQYLAQIIGLIQQSGKLSRYSNGAIDDYHEALQQTWLHLCHHLDAYDPDRASVITWLNTYLKYRLLDQRVAQKKERGKTVSGYLSADGEWIDPLDKVPSPEAPPPLLEEIQIWLQENAGSLRRKHIYQRPEVNCYVLILRRLPPETSWSELSKTFGVPISTLSNFYQRECLPRLRTFIEFQGY